MRIGPALLAVAVILLAGVPLAPLGAADHVDPILVDGNPHCTDLAERFAPGEAWLELKVHKAPDGTFSDGTLTVTISNSTGTSFDWSSNIGVDAVFVKAGPGGNVYLYEPESTGDTGLESPINPDNGKHYDISHISFCYDASIATCQASGLSVAVPTLGANVTMAASDARAVDQGRTDGKARQAGLAAAPGLLDASVVESTCTADNAGPNAGIGTASVEDLSLDLRPLGVDLQLRADAVREDATALGRTGGTAGARLVGLTARAAGTTVGPVNVTPPPNCRIPLASTAATPEALQDCAGTPDPGLSDVGASIGYVVLNEQTRGGCPFSTSVGEQRTGNALRLVLFDTTTSDPDDVALEVVVGHVDVAACGAPREVTRDAGCDATGLTVDVVPDAAGERAVQAEHAVSSVEVAGSAEGDAGSRQTEVSVRTPAVPVDASTLSSACDATTFDVEAAGGQARVEDLHLSLTVGGVPVELEADLFQVDAASGKGASTVDTTVLNATVTVDGQTVEIPDPIPPNTVIPLSAGPADVGELRLREGHGTTADCGADGAALRLVLFEPGTTEKAAEVVAAAVGTGVC